MSNEKNEAKVKTQISWRDLGDNIIADLPGNETITFDMKELHETWIDFMKRYGVRQYVSSSLAKMSYSMRPELKVQIIEAQVAVSARDDEEKVAAEKILNDLRDVSKAEKAAWLKDNAAEIRSFLWKEFQALKSEKAVKEKADRETKAQVEARVRADLIAKTKASLEAAGMPEDFINGIISAM